MVFKLFSRFKCIFSFDNKRQLNLKQEIKVVQYAKGLIVMTQSQPSVWNGRIYSSKLNIIFSPLRLCESHFFLQDVRLYVNFVHLRMIYSLEKKPAIIQNVLNTRTIISHPYLRFRFTYILSRPDFKSHINMSKRCMQNFFPCMIYFT